MLVVGCGRLLLVLVDVGCWLLLIVDYSLLIANCRSWIACLFVWLVVCLIVLFACLVAWFFCWSVVCFFVCFFFCFFVCLFVCLFGCRDGLFLFGPLLLQSPLLCLGEYSLLRALQQQRSDVNLPCFNVTVKLSEERPLHARSDCE